MIYVMFVVWVKTSWFPMRFDVIRYLEEVEDVGEGL